jgi:hypothetical protein
MTARRFPPPWTVEELDACFIVRDHNGQALAYVYAQSKSDRSPGTNHIKRALKGASNSPNSAAP